MKELLTVFFVIVVCLCTKAQTVPMTILGDVYIANGGKMKSEGTVHLKAIDDEKTGRVDNYGKFVMVDSIILYTNDLLDGLLRNGEGPGDGEVQAGNVAVRKNLSVTNTWYTFSLPFDVDIYNGIRTTFGNGRKLVRGTDFEIQFYDAYKRSQTGKHGDQNWVVVPYDGSDSIINIYKAQYFSSDNKTMSKGRAYRIAVKFSQLDGEWVANKGKNYDIEFVAKGSQDITELFTMDDKGLSLKYNAINPALIIPVNPNTPPDGDAHNSDGWNIIGGLNSDLFSLNGNNLDYDRTVYVIQNGEREWEPYYPLAAKANKDGLLRPYGAIFIKSDGTNLLYAKSETRDAGSFGGFAYKYGGNIIKPEVGAPLFRSSKMADYDLFELDIEDAKNSSNLKKTYFKFNNKYSSFYKSSEDDITWSTAKSDTKTVVWSLAAMEGKGINNYLFVNALPYGEQEIPLGVSIPSAGEYIFSLKHITMGVDDKIRSVILWDKVEDIKIELLQTDYRLQANGNFNTENRFVIFFNNKDVTALDKMPDLLDIYGYVEDNILTIKNLQPGDRVQVLDLTGRTIVMGIASGNRFTAPLNQKGIYIVNVRGGKTLKILNK